jgi:hypothetical protein
MVCSREGAGDLLKIGSFISGERGACAERRGRVAGGTSAARACRAGVRLGLAALVPFLLVLAGCGGGQASGSGGGLSNGTFTISPSTQSGSSGSVAEGSALTIDTNCTGCNASSSGNAYEQFTATLRSGGPASVTWSVSGGDVSAGAGSINASGQYTPPSYLTADSVPVTVTATLSANPSQKASVMLTVTPGFLQPLTPENLALGSGGTAKLTGYIAEAGGSLGINYAVAGSANGTGSGQGSLNDTKCVRDPHGKAFTYCTVTYAAPAAVTSTSASYVVGTIGTSSSTASAVVLLNSEGVNSDPTTHEQQLATPVTLGSSGGNNNSYDTSGGNIVDCCGGTLGALIQDSSGTQYILSNNHVLARSDQASIGETIVQPGLIDDNCSPYPGGALTAIGTLTGFVPIKPAAGATTNVDAAIAQVNPGAVSPSGAILELGTPQGNGTLAAAPPGISSTGGRGETAAVGMKVAKSGRTTGLTCASVAAVSLTVKVDYFSNCAESKPYYTKTYSNQVGVEGNQFSDAGDSGSLVVDTSDAEPVGLFFAGGQTASGVGEGVANPVGDVLNELSAQPFAHGTSYTFVGTADHPVSCLSYGNGTATAAQSRSLTGAEMDRTEQAMMDARALVNSRSGVLGVATGKSSDQGGEGAVIVYVDPRLNPAVPATIHGVRTEVIPASTQAVATGMAPQSRLAAGPLPSLPSAALRAAIGIQKQLAASLLAQNPGFFGVGVGQSLDDPTQAALVIYVDRTRVPAQLPAAIDGLRTRYVIMERLHVTRAYLSPVPKRSHCMPHAAPSAADSGLIETNKLRGLNLY